MCDATTHTIQVSKSLTWLYKSPLGISICCTKSYTENSLSQVLYLRIGIGYQTILDSTIAYIENTYWWRTINSRYFRGLFASPDAVDGSSASLYVNCFFYLYLQISISKTSFVYNLSIGLIWWRFTLPILVWWHTVAYSVGTFWQNMAQEYRNFFWKSSSCIFGS